EFQEAMAAFSSFRQKKIQAGPPKDSQLTMDEELAEVDKPNSKRIFIMAGIGLIVFAVIFFLVLKFFQ
ncbi:MAG TPA: hypothetical protein VGY77_04735, partial [Gemmataceae bacterium]|nr:hypothetical protein [Gemmataceae bacterium]